MVNTSSSILNSTKKALGVIVEDTFFDSIIIMHINSVFATLQQLGVGPVEGFMIANADDTWENFVTKTTLNSVKSYMYLKVRLLFDPPSTSHATSAMENMAKEYEWRLNVHVESPTNSGPPLSWHAGENGIDDPPSTTNNTQWSAT